MNSSRSIPAMPPVMTRVKPGLVQRKCACGGRCESCREPEKEKPAGVVQRQATPTGRAAAAASSVSPPVTAQIHSAAHGGGNPLPAPARTMMETRFGNRDFSGVRVHTDSASDSLTRQLGAEAFTVGNSVFFSANRYDPGSMAGQKLLAHELTHVVQQGGAGGQVQARLELGAPDTGAEREANRVAESIVGGASAGPIARVGAGTLQRQVFGVGTPESKGFPPALMTERNEKGGQRVVLPPNVPLEVLGLKANDSTDHEDLKQLYETVAKNKALRTTHPGRRVGIWPVWKRAREGMTNAAGQGPDVIEKTMHSVCSPDHMIELQVNGPDVANNLRLLSQGRNEKAGSQMAGQLRRLMNVYLAGADESTSYLEFTAVRKEGTPDEDKCLVADPLLHPQGKIAAATGPRGAPFSQRLLFQVGGVPTAISYGAAGETQTPFTINPDHRFAVPGLHLKQVKVPPSGTTVITANLSEKVRKLPLKGGKYPDFDLEVVDSPARLKISESAPPAITLTFPFLSEASLVPRLENGQWVAIGDFTPTVPLLKLVQVHLEIRHGGLQGGVTVPPEKLRQALPVPGLTLDPVNLVIGIADGEFSATGGFGFRYGVLASGLVTAGFSPAAGFTADGNINLHIPGLDQARGDAHVRNGRFGARLTVGKDKVKFPGVRSADLVVDVADGVLSGTGTIVLVIPGLHDARLQFAANSQGQYGITGTATGSIPGLRDPRLEIGYANGALSGQGHAGFIIPGFEGGALDLRYSNGQFSGSASIDYRRGRLSGHIGLNLTPAFRLTGGGQLGYEIVPGLIALVGLDVLETGATRVSGEIRLPDPLVLFAEKAIQKRLFGISLDIPIFGISFGASSIGVIANLAAALDARAGIGPGQLRHSKIVASFDPSRELSAASFRAAAELYVPASAEILVVLSGGIGVSLLIVKALGGIQATGAAGLTGALAIPVELRYIAGRFAVDGAAELFAQPRLRFQLDAFVRVIADLLLTTIDVYDKQWKLAAYEWGSDFRIGLRFPVHYVFGEPFTLSLDQVQFIAPQIDTRKLIADLLPK